MDEIKDMIDSSIIHCEQVIRDLDRHDETEGVLRLLIKRWYFDDLANRCARLMLEESFSDEDLEEAFGEDIFKRGKELYNDMHRRWCNSFAA